MRYIGSYDAEIGETRIDLQSSCHTDAIPLVSRLIFRQDVDLSSQCLPLACAMLTRDYCGQHFDFGSTTIASDYAEAISAVFDRSVTICNVQGNDRTICTGEIDIVSSRASSFETFPDTNPDVPVDRIAWYGDFVSPKARHSRGFVFGQYFTNASLFADDTVVSAAMGLIHRGDRCRVLHVPLNRGAAASDYEFMRIPLRIVGIRLAFFPARDVIAAALHDKDGMREGRDRALPAVIGG